MLPKHFCWTRFGTEAGEKIDSILARKEGERLVTGGMFLWGIGNSVGPAIRDLIRLEERPMVLFSPMRSKPKAIDVAPTGLTVWSEALDLDGRDWTIPEGVKVTSRQGSETGRTKRSHYALVCRSSSPLTALDLASLRYEELVNLQSKNKLGASQVTAVVEQLARGATECTTYPVAFMAELVFPYFVKLGGPLDSSTQVPKSRGRSSYHHQPSLLAA
ncbi:hypothetical protein [Hydrogenophaga sp.]|uniref:hypothetical protein n=1 Tax=Hydrogenophaga sp. TaxID=1904254 RepID=UPI002735F927|nr:hypothetical protein [Hydrogenophaga sp.]MDP3888201.1 hypothetical protein [Hydrogenophaga sp.]